MKLKNTIHDSWKPVLEQHYKKPYLLRKIKEQEAEEEIRTYDKRTSSSFSTPEMSYPSYVDEEGKM
jgi:hypothetical protein